MRNKCAEALKNISSKEWKKICDNCLTNNKLKEYLKERFGFNFSSTVIQYHSKKMGYKCPLSSCAKDERGNRYGHLTVKDFFGIDPKSKRILWTCICDCGEVEVREGSELRRPRNKNQMCKKCFKKNMSKISLDDLTGRTFNLLKVEKRVGTRQPCGNALYQCLCLNCGNRINVDSGVLKSGQVSCGCINSKGEYYINKILQELKISYKTQYQFPDCRNILPLRFDFAIFKEEEIKCLIEFQGKQHYSKIDNGTWKDTEEAFLERVKKDNIKRYYCQKNNIPLIEISYKDLNKINRDFISDLLKPFDL